MKKEKIIASNGVARWVNGISLTDMDVYMGDADGDGQEVRIKATLNIPSVGISLPFNIGCKNRKHCFGYDLTMAHSTNKEVDNES